MGIFSDIWKGVKNVFKGVGKAVKKVFKEVKRFVKSDIGKVIIASAAIYYGGKALKWWGTDGAASNTLKDTLTESTINAGAGNPAASAFTGQAPVDFATGGAGQNLTGLTAENTLNIGSSEIAKASAPGMVEQATTASNIANANNAGPNTGLWSKIKQAGSDAKGWMEKNPELTLGIGKGLTAALAPDPYDQWRKQQEWMRKNSNIAGINGDGSGRRISMGLPTRASYQNRRMQQKSTIPGRTA